MGSASSDFAFESPQAALEALLASIKPVVTENVKTEVCAGRILAEAVRADRDSPACDVSAMDGFAARVSDLGGADLPIVGEARVGSAPLDLRPGTAIRIATGAPIPTGADAVIRIEDANERNDRIRVSPERTAVLRAGTYIRHRGENARSQACIVEPGIEASPPVAGAIASIGALSVTVHRAVRVSLVITGDEIVGSEVSPQPWQVRDCNAPSMRALLGRRRWIECADPVRVADDARALQRVLESSLAHCDALVLAGGASVGARDFAAAAIRAAGATVVFHRLPQRPGRPLLGAVLPDGRPILALPGNPLSVLVTGRRFLVPALQRLAGCRAIDSVPAVAPASRWQALPDLWWHRAVRLNDRGLAEPVEVASSGDIAGAARSHGFIEIPPGDGGVGPWPYFGWNW